MLRTDNFLHKFRSENGTEEIIAGNKKSEVPLENPQKFFRLFKRMDESHKKPCK